MNKKGNFSVVYDSYSEFSAGSPASRAPNQENTLAQQKIKNK